METVSVAAVVARADAFAAAHRYAEALSALQEAERLLGDKPEGKALAELCHVRLQSGRLRRIIGDWEQALKDFKWVRVREGGPQDGLRRRLMADLGTADILSRRGEYQKALDLLDNAARMGRKQNVDEGLMLQVDVHRAMLNSRAGELETGSALLAQSLEKLKAHEKARQNLDVVSLARCQQGLDAMRRGSLKEAATTFTECIAMLSDPRYDQDRAEALRYLGVTQSASGQYIDALRSHMKALDVFSKAGNLFGQARVYNSIGRNFLSMNETAEAIYFMEKGQQICACLRADAEMATTCGKLGEVYMHLQDLQNAIKYFEKDLELSDRFKNYYALGYTYRNLGRIHMQLGQVDEAKRFLNESLTLFQYVEDRMQIGRVYFDLAHLHYNCSELPAAEEVAAKGSAILNEFPHAAEIHWLAAIQAMCLRRRGRPSEAVPALTAALDGLQQPESLAFRIEVMEELACAYKDLKRGEQALAQLKAALRLAKEHSFTRSASRLMALIETIDQQELLRQFTRRVRR